MAEGLGAVVLYVLTVLYSLFVGGAAVLVLGVRNRPRSTVLGGVCGVAGLLVGGSLGPVQGGVGLAFGAAGFAAGVRFFPRDTLPLVSGRVFGVLAVLAYVAALLIGLVLLSIFVTEGLSYTVSQLPRHPGAGAVVLVASVLPVAAGVAGLWLEWRRSKA